MNTRTAKGRKAPATKTAPTRISAMKRRLGNVWDALETGAGAFGAWVRQAIPAMGKGFARFGKTAADTATAIGEELKDDVAGVKKRLAEKKESVPAAKPAVRKTAGKKAAARRKAPARRKAVATKAAARRAGPRTKKRTPHRKAAGSAK